MGGGEEILQKVACMVQKAEKIGASEEGTLVKGTRGITFRSLDVLWPGELLRGPDP